ncbi:MAG: DUF4352 domain-containing protein [Thermoprotei archaeon]|nr:MAG: DUF4352 domain-containing protein [Thermoprotei archaeon]RLE99846.1 MAG: DUF4352 domain-containing protein [Thermoprotei archaeon]
MLLNKKAISPVIATVIIVAVTLTIAIAVAYWMGGIAGLYTRFEKIEVAGATVIKKSETTASGTIYYWEITLTVKNTGSADATIDNIIINGIPISQIQDPTEKLAVTYDNTTVDLNNIRIPVNAGEEKKIVITVGEGATVGSGKLASAMSVEIKIHTAAGKDYPKLITLP